MRLPIQTPFKRFGDPATLACGIFGLSLMVALLGPLDTSGMSARTTLPTLVDAAKIRSAQPPVPPPMRYSRMSLEEAAAFNAALPFSHDVNTPAKPFTLKARSADYARSLECLTAAAYYEASGEGPVGEAAVAQVVLNRVRHPAFPASVCAVVYQGSTRSTGCQFTFTCDGSLLRARHAGGWRAARTVAARALSGSLFAGVGLATHYHTKSVVPYWASSLAKNAQVGAHIFYRWPDEWGRPAAFRQRYGGEPWQEMQLRNASLVAHGKAPITGAGPPIAVVFNEVPAPGPLSVVSQLAGGEPRTPNPKIAEAGFEDERAVMAFREFATAHPDADLTTISALLSAPTSEPKVPGVAELGMAMKDFAASSAYARYVERARGSATERKRFSLALLSALRDIQAYTGVLLGTVSVTLQPAPGNTLRGMTSCPTEGGAGRSKRTRRAGRGLAQPEVKDPLGAQLAQAAADYLTWAARTEGKGMRSGSACSSADQQVVGAILNRMIALRKGEAAAHQRLSWEVHHGHELVALLAQRLRVFEARRDRFVTLAEAYGALTNGLPAVPAEQPADPVLVP